MAFKLKVIACTEEESNIGEHLEGLVLLAREQLKMCPY